MGKDFLLNERPLQVTVGRRRMRAVDGTADRAFSDGSSRYAGIAHTGGAAHQTVEPQHRNRAFRMFGVHACELLQPLACCPRTKRPSPCQTSTEFLYPSPTRDLQASSSFAESGT